MNNERGSKARYLRKKYAAQGVDEQQQYEQKQFQQNYQQAINNHSHKLTTKNIQDQVQYFGTIIQPFNMKQQQNMGQIDSDGFFLFKRKNLYKDAWLDSIEQGNDQMIADKIKKKIKTQGGNQYKGLYDIQSKQINHQQQQQQNDKISQNQDQDQDQDQDEQQYIEQKQQQQQEQDNKQSMLKPIQIKQLLCQLLPMNKSANVYIKQLKKTLKKSQQDKQIHDKLLQLSQMYIQQTNQYDILTKKKQILQLECAQQSQQQKQLHWDQSDSQFHHQIKMHKNINSKNTIKQKQINQQNQQNDDIF